MEDATPEELSRQQEQKAAAIAKLQRYCVETAPLPTQSQTAYRLLACPFIYGVNLLPQATGFGDLDASGNFRPASSDKNITKVKGAELTLLTMAQIFYGMCSQKACGTPSILDWESWQSSDETQQRQALIRIFTGQLQALKSGTFNKNFANVWKQMFKQVPVHEVEGEIPPPKLLNYLDLQYMFGTAPWKSTLDNFISPKQGRGKSGGRGRGRGRGGRNSVSVLLDDDDDDDDDDDVASGGTTNARGRNLQDPTIMFGNYNETVSDTNHSVQLNNIRLESEEKISIFLYRVYRQTGTRVAAVIPPAATMNHVRSRGHIDLSDMDLAWDDADPLSSEDISSEDPLLVLNGLAHMNLADSTISLESSPGVEGSTTTSGNTSSFLPFLNHAKTQAEDMQNPSIHIDRGLDYYYVPEGLDNGGHEFIKEYGCFPFGSVKNNSGELPIETAEVGFIMLAKVNDINWVPKTVMIGMCNESNAPAQANGRSGGRGGRGRGAGRGRGRGQGGSWSDNNSNPFYCDWTADTTHTHVGRSNYNERVWNNWAILYTSVDMTCVDKEQWHTCDMDETGNLDDYPVGHSPLREHGDNGGLSRTDMIAASALEGFQSIEDPEHVFSLANAMRWMDYYGGDTRELVTTISYPQYMGQPHDLRNPGAIPEVTCAFITPSFYRMPYRIFCWGTDSFAGLKHNYFPWHEDPMTAFIKHKLLGLKKNNPCLPAQLKLCLNSTALAAAAERREEEAAAAASHGDEHQDYSNIPLRVRPVEQMIQCSAGGDSECTNLFREMRRDLNVSRVAAQCGFNMLQFDAPSSELIKAVIDLTKRAGLFTTQLIAETVNEALTSILDKKLNGTSLITRNNQILIIQELLNQLYELVLQEKPNECLVIKQLMEMGGVDHTTKTDITNRGSTSSWFGVTEHASGYGHSDTWTNTALMGRPAFCKQFQRYVGLKESYEALACDHLKDALSSHRNILTRGIKVLIQYQQQHVHNMGMDVDILDMGDCALFSYIGKKALEVRFVLNIPHATRHFLIIQLGLNDYCRWAYQLHFNYYNTGDGAASKSHISEKVNEMMIDGTVTSVDDSTPRAMFVENEDLTDRNIYVDEVGANVQGGGKDSGESDMRATLFKRLLTGGKVTLEAFEWRDDANGVSRRTKRILVVNCQGCFGGCGNLNNFTPATLTRMYRQMYGRTQINFGPMVRSLSRDKFEAYVHEIQNQMASGSSMQDLCKMSLEDIEVFLQKAKTTNRAHVNVPNLANQSLSKTADLLISQHIHQTSVTEAMFLDNFLGAEDDPFQQNSDASIKKKIRLEQLLIAYTFKLIQVRALPDVNLTVAHMVVQHFFAYLSHHGNINVNNYRVYTRIMIMCRILTIQNALLQVFGVDGCDVDPNQPFNVGLLRALKPYLFSTMKIAVFAVTLMADEYIGPFNSMILNILGTVLCRYPDRARLNREFRQGDNLLAALELLDGIVTTVDVKTSLETLCRYYSGDALKQQMSQAALNTLPTPNSVGLVANGNMVSRAGESAPMSGAPNQASIHLQADNVCVESDNDDGEGEYSEESMDSHNDRELRRRGLDPQLNRQPLHLDDDCEYPGNDADIEADESTVTVTDSDMYGNAYTDEDDRITNVNTRLTTRDKDTLELPLTKLIKRFIEGQLLPHELYIIHKHDVKSPILWDSSEFEPNTPANVQSHSAGATFAPGVPNMAGLPAFSNNSHEYNNRPVKTVAFDLNYVTYSAFNIWSAMKDIRSAMLNIGPGLSDIKELIEDHFCSQKITVPWAYTGTFSDVEIRDLTDKSIEELEQSGVIKRNVQLAMCKIRNRDSNVTYGLSICVYAMEAHSDPKDLIYNAVRSLIHQHMQPCRFTLGLMADSNRAKFAWLDVTPEDIASAKQKSWTIVTGAFMTERERTVVYYKDNWEKQAGFTGADALNLLYNKSKNASSVNSAMASSQPGAGAKNSAPSLNNADPDPDDELDSEYQQESSEWIKVVNEQASLFISPTAVSSNVISIKMDLDLWACKRFFLSAGIPHGPHPLRPSQLCWYYRPLRIDSELRQTCSYAPDYVEYRDFPTAYNQHVRNIYYLVNHVPQKFDSVCKVTDVTGVSDPWVQRALKHFEWLQPKKAINNRPRNPRTGGIPGQVRSAVHNLDNGATSSSNRNTIAFDDHSPVRSDTSHRINIDVEEEEEEDGSGHVSPLKRKSKDSQMSEHNASKHKKARLNNTTADLETDVF